MILRVLIRKRKAPEALLQKITAQETDKNPNRLASGVDEYHKTNDFLVRRQKRAQVSSNLSGWKTVFSGVNKGMILRTNVIFLV